jgi:erythritol kinase (D-erythritol 1-phosphate-forming)
MPAMVGTAALDWVLAMIGARHTEVDSMLAGTRPDPGGVVCLPYFSPAGERAPFVEAGARARFDGLTVHTTRAELVRAVCEAIAMAARHCFEAAGLFEPSAGRGRGTVTCCGGGIRSRHWLQMFADVLGREVRVASKPEVGAYGAVLAGVGALGGLGVDPAEWAEPDLVVQPVPALMGVYAGMYDRYRAAVDRARADWSQPTPRREREGTKERERSP